MALTDVDTLANNATFKAQFKAALMKHAVFVGANTAVNNNDTMYAVQVINNIDTYANTLSYAAAAWADGVSPANDAGFESLAQTVFPAAARR